jgi:hypothetical protein
MEWAYLKTAKFVSSYADATPFEDFADSFAAYFSEKLGFEWYRAPYGDPGAAGAPDKMAHIDAWARTLLD